MLFALRPLHQRKEWIIESASTTNANRLLHKCIGIKYIELRFNGKFYMHWESSQLTRPTTICCVCNLHDTRSDCWCFLLFFHALHFFFWIISAPSRVMILRTTDVHRRPPCDTYSSMYVNSFAAMVLNIYKYIVNYYYNIYVNTEWTHAIYVQLVMSSLEQWVSVHARAHTFVVQT